MGTLLGERGVGFGHPYARANLSHPEMVAGIHEEYLRAGASVIETNTFSANRYKLEIHDLEESVRQVNIEGARLARRAADTLAADTLVLGAIGPLGRPLAPIGSVSPEEAREVFLEQAEALLEGGADALLLETFTDLAELRLAYDAVRLFGRPVLAYKTFVEDGETLAEGLPERAAHEISSWGADLTGANCTVGPQRMVDIVEQMSAGAGPVAAFPNPGLPQLVEGSVLYNRDARHFAAYGVKLAEAGAHLIGGCCGTTPAHIRALSEALRDFKVEGRVTRRRGYVAEKEVRPGISNEPVSGFAEKLQTGFAVTVEIDLPRGNDIQSVVEAAQRLQRRGVDAIDISDGARARLRMHPVAAAKIVQDEAAIEVVAHISCRDRNIIGLQADLLGAAALGVKNILAVTGDPAQIGDYPEATSVFDMDSVGLIHILSRMNAGGELSRRIAGLPHRGLLQPDRRGPGIRGRQAEAQGGGWGARLLDAAGLRDRGSGESPRGDRRFGCLHPPGAYAFEERSPSRVPPLRGSRYQHPSWRQRQARRTVCQGRPQVRGRTDAEPPGEGQALGQGRLYHAASERTRSRRRSN